jgi:hypothetical protein
MQLTLAGSVPVPEPSETPSFDPGRGGAEGLAATGPGDVELASESPPPGELASEELPSSQLPLNFGEPEEEP